METPFHVVEEDAGQRLDVYCARRISERSRVQIQRAIKDGTITVNGDAVKPRYTVAAGDIVRVDQKLREEREVEDIAAGAADLKLPIIHEDEHIVVIDKPAGVAVHRGVGGERETVAGWFAVRYPDASDVGEHTERPGIVHRLDKDTSGVMVLAKTPEAYANLKSQFQRRRAKKEYLALVFGVPEDKDGRITRPLARSKRNPMRRQAGEHGKQAITEWKKETSFGGDYALLRVFPLTGRTHQIRAHLHFLGFPIVGDPLYTFKRQSLPAGASAEHGQLLHAEQLTITHPETNRQHTFTAEIPAYFVEVLEHLQQ